VGELQVSYVLGFLVMVPFIGLLYVIFSNLFIIRGLLEQKKFLVELKKELDKKDQGADAFYEMQDALKKELVEEDQLEKSDIVDPIEVILKHGDLYKAERKY
jgi:hypothetical protein